MPHGSPAEFLSFRLTDSCVTAKKTPAMDKRPHQNDEPDVSHPKWPRTAHSLPDGGAHRRHEAIPPPGHSHYTIAWICALPLELAASRAMLDEEHQMLPLQPGDENTYILGRIDRHNVVMACLPGHYGTNNAAIVATDLKRSFPSIRATLMVGIGGGAPAMADLRLGDVVVGTRVMQYDMGRDVGDGRFEITADAKIPARLLLSAVSTVRTTHEQDGSSGRVTSLMRTRLSSHPRPSQPGRLFLASYDHPPGSPTCDGCDPDKVQPQRVRVSDEPKIHYGGIASGNSVMRSAKKRDDIAQRFSVLCFEMEAAGMMDWQCLPIRGICDYADSHKNKDWQDYAAATAAAYATELLEALPVARTESGRAASWLTTASQPDAVGMLPSLFSPLHADRPRPWPIPRTPPTAARVPRLPANRRAQDKH
jgi:nucleoside phosphorylase